MNRIEKKIMWNIKFGFTPMMIESSEKVIILHHIGKYHVSGHVFPLDGSSESNCKQCNIKTTKSGKRYIMADRTKFELDCLQPCEISRETLEAELAICNGLKKTYTEMRDNGDNVGASIENEDFYIANITEYLHKN